MGRKNDASGNWATLRATRASPPAATANDGKRRATYVSALEQSEQLFAAASIVGPATSPLLLYYGLSQAGRAIAAAARDIREDWRLVGHGINRGDLALPLPSVPVFAEGSKGSFVRLSGLLDSPVWEKADPVELSALWDALPQTLDWPLRNTADRRTAHYVAYHGFDQPHPLASVNLCYLPSWLASSSSPGDDLRSYLRSYPTIGAYTYAKSGAGPVDGPAMSVYEDGRVEVTLNLVVDDKSRSVPEADRRAYFEKIATSHGDRSGAFYLVPAVGSNHMPMHPLMTWWAVLYTLSMLARYQPAEWATYINVDESIFAVPIERLLDHALEEVPALIAATIRSVS